MNRKGISPAITVIFLVAVSVAIGIALYAWQTGWFATQSRMVDIHVAAEIQKASTAEQVNIQIKNIGTVRVKILTIKITNESGVDPNKLSAGGAFEGLDVTADNENGIYIDDVNIELDPGSIISGTITYSDTGAWKSGASYIITVVFEDVDRGTTLTKTVKVQA